MTNQSESQVNTGNMKVVILCGGQGIRLNNSLEFIPKGMVKIGHRPLLWHVMKIYAAAGFTEFVLALGANSNSIRDYFLHYDENLNDLTVTLGSGKIEYNSQHQEEKWKITFVETGQQSGTGARLFRCQKYLEGQDFCLTYSDCLSNIDIKKLVTFHKKHNKLATISGVMPPFRYGEFIMENNELVDYQEISKLKSNNGWVNGGFMVFGPNIFNYLTPYNECVLEKEVFSELTKKRELAIYEHTGFWQCLDNEREYKYLNNLAEKNSEFWLQKND
jgi:glucose-1-phosphate cytidylyltransferase